MSSAADPGEKGLWVTETPILAVVWAESAEEATRLFMIHLATPEDARSGAWGQTDWKRLRLGNVSRVLASSWSYDSRDWIADE